MTGKLSEEQRANCLEVGGLLYATLDFAPPNGEGTGDQSGALGTLEGWELVPNISRVVQEVIAKHSWGSTVLILRDGTGYGTSLHASPGAALKTDHLKIQRARSSSSTSDDNAPGGERYQPKDTLDEYHRILMRTNPGSFSCTSPSFTNNLLMRMFDSQSFTDCAISCRGETLQCHRAVLSLSSVVFQRMFESDMREGLEHRIEISDAEPHIIRSMLQFMYTGDVVIKYEDLWPMVATSDKYAIEELCITCAKRGVDLTDKGNVAVTIGKLAPFKGRPAFEPVFELVRKVMNSMLTKDELIETILNGSFDGITES